MKIYLIKNKSLVDALSKVKDYTNNDLSALINATRERFGVNSLDIRNGSMPSKTAKAVTKTSTDCLSYLIEYFNYISRQDLMNKILIMTLNDRLVEASFGHISEKIEGSNPSCLKSCYRGVSFP